MSPIRSHGNDADPSEGARHSDGLVPIVRSAGSAPLEPGTLLADKFRVERLLGYWGGLGWVYLATQERVGRRVAIKVLRRELVTRRESVSLFIDISLRLGGVGHPNLVPVFDFGEAPDGGLYMAMQYLKGVSLQAVLSHAGRLGWRAATDVVRQAAAALGAAHELGVHHGDLKPTNLFINHSAVYGDMVKVLDFALADLLGRPDDTEGDRAASVCGTPEYMAPETSLHGHHDARSDVYSLGCVFYQMIAGRLPYVAPDAVQTAMLHQLAAVPALEPGLAPGPFADLILRMMDKNPARRPSNGGAVLAGLLVAEEEWVRYDDVPTAALDGSALSFLETEAWATHFDSEPPNMELAGAGELPPSQEAVPADVFEPDLLTALPGDPDATSSQEAGLYAGPVQVQSMQVRQEYQPPPAQTSSAVLLLLIAGALLAIGTFMALAALAVVVFR